MEKWSKKQREFVKILRKNGYTMTRISGSHAVFMNRNNHKHITVNRNLNRMVRERLIKENNLEV